MKRLVASADASRAPAVPAEDVESALRSATQEANSLISWTPLCHAPVRLVGPKIDSPVDLPIHRRLSTRRPRERCDARKNRGAFEHQGILFGGLTPRDWVSPAASLAGEADEESPHAFFTGLPEWS